MKRTTALLVSIFFLIPAGCSDRESGNPDLPDQQYDSAQISLLNFYTGPGNIVWSFNDSIIEDSHAYGYRIPRKKIRWVKGNTKQKIDVISGSTGELFTTETVSLQPEFGYIGIFTGTPDDQKMAVISQEDALPSPDNCIVCFFNTLSDVGAIDIYIGGTHSSNKKISALPFGVFSNYYEIPASSLSDAVIITPAGVLPGDTENLVDIIGNSSHSSGRIYNDIVARPVNLSSEPTLFIYEQ